jgi:CheY-like chemotaxis protein
MLREIQESDPPRLDGVRVLVVDDSVGIREIVQEVLKYHGADVTAVDSAREALAVLQRERPAVLVSDLGMPGEDGYWLIREVRALPSERGGQTPAAALSGYATPEDRARVLGAGFQYHIAKPCHPRHLVGIVSILATKE